MSHAMACSDVAVLPPKNGIGEAIGGAGSEERHDPHACSLCCPFWGGVPNSSMELSMKALIVLRSRPQYSRPIGLNT